MITNLLYAHFLENLFCMKPSVLLVPLALDRFLYAFLHELRIIELPILAWNKEALEQELLASVL